ESHGLEQLLRVYEDSGLRGKTICLQREGRLESLDGSIHFEANAYILLLYLDPLKESESFGCHAHTLSRSVEHFFETVSWGPFGQASNLHISIDVEAAHTNVHVRARKSDTQLVTVDRKDLRSSDRNVNAVVTKLKVIDVVGFERIPLRSLVG